MKKAKKDMIVYRGASVPAMDVMVDGETVWLSIDQMAELFGRDPSVIGKHVRNVFSEEELEILPNRQNLPICGKIHPVAYYRRRTDDEKHDQEHSRPRDGRALRHGAGGRRVGIILEMEGNGAAFASWC